MATTPIRIRDLNEEIKAGDTLSHYSSHGAYIGERKVDRVLKTQIVINGVKYRKDGSEFGDEWKRCQLFKQVEIPGLESVSNSEMVERLFSDDGFQGYRLSIGNYGMITVSMLKDGTFQGKVRYQTKGEAVRAVSHWIYENAMKQTVGR